MGIFIRILLRYAAAALVAKGVLSPGLGDMVSLDPDVSALVEIVAGALAMAIAELWYAIARRFGWPT